MPKDKVIAYFSKYKAAGRSDSSDNQNGVPLVPTNRDDRKVLVDAGDKCVAPAKSRPKKRKSVKPLRSGERGGDGSLQRPTETGIPDVAESVIWSDQVYTVRHLVKQFDGQFPVIVRVDDGHYREGVVDLARGQVLLVSNHGKQRRILARNNSTETLLSLPVDYQMDILLSSSAEILDFTTAVNEGELPFAATVYSVSPVSNTSQGNLTGEHLTFLSLKDTVFLRANSISHGWTDQSEILVIPELVQVQFSVAEGLQGGSEQEWRDYQGMFARCVRHLSFNLMTGYKGILLEGPDGNELLLASTCHLMGAESTTAECQSPEAANESKKQRIAYENFRMSREEPMGRPDGNLHRNAEDAANVYDDLLFADNRRTSDYDNIGHVDDRINDGAVGIGLNRNPLELMVISCSNGTLDYRKPREDPPPSRTCSDVSEANYEVIDQVFAEIVDLNKGDQTQVAANGINIGALDLCNEKPVEDNFLRGETSVNSVGDDVTSGFRARNTNGLVGKGGDKLSTNLIEMEDNKEKESPVCDNPNPIVKTNILRLVSEFQSINQVKADDIRLPKHPQQLSESKSEFEHANSRSDHQQQPTPFGFENSKLNLMQKTKPDLVQNPKPVVIEKLKLTQVNRVQTSQKSLNVVGLRHQDRPTFTNDTTSGTQEAFSGHPNRIQPPQKPAKPLHDMQEEKRISYSSAKPSAPNATSSPLSRTPVATKPLADSKPNRLSHPQSFHNRTTKNNLSATSSYPSTKPNPPLPPPISAHQRSSVIRDLVIKSSADVPSELESLSVSGVAQCLELLRLDKHVADFNRNAIDGRKLTDLTEKDLEQQFRFTPLDASKLVRFIRGWRP